MRKLKKVSDSILNSKGVQMKKQILALLTFAGFALGNVALAHGADDHATDLQFAKPEAAVKYCEGVFTVMAAHFGKLGAMASGKAPFDAKSAAANADLVANLAHLPWGGFGKETAAIKSEAKPEVWSSPAKFKELAEKLEMTTDKLATVAKAGNENDFKAAFKDVAGTCKACHTDYKQK